MTAPTVVHCVVRDGRYVAVRGYEEDARAVADSFNREFGDTTYTVEERVAISRLEYDALLRDKADLEWLQERFHRIATDHGHEMVAAFVVTPTFGVCGFNDDLRKMIWSARNPEAACKEASDALPSAAAGVGHA